MIASQIPARMIEVISPAGFEGFFRDLSQLLAAELPPPDVVAEIAAAHGLEFGKPDWLPRHHHQVRAQPTARALSEGTEPGQANPSQFPESHPIQSCRLTGLRTQRRDLRGY